MVYYVLWEKKISEYNILNLVCEFSIMWEKKFNKRKVGEKSDWSVAAIGGVL